MQVVARMPPRPGGRRSGRPGASVRRPGRRRRACLGRKHRTSRNMPH